MPHGLLTAMHLERMLSGWGATSETARVLARVLGGHHGVIPEAASVRQAGHAVGAHGGRNWQLRCDAIANEACKLWGLPEPSELAWSEVSVPPAAALALAGLATVSDWIASTLPPASYAGADVDLGTYAAVARRAAAGNVTALGWTPWHGPDDIRFTALFPADVPPRPVQLAVQDAAGGASGPGIMVISAPTGEGKTKAALQAAVALMRRLELNGFYAALPSRASSNQAFEVADQLLAPLGQADRLRLVHSSAAAYLLKRRRVPGEGEMRFYEIAVDGTGATSGGDDEPGELVAEDWFTRRRGLLAPFGAGTVDQVLTAAIRSSHVFVRLAGLSGKVIVFDEVHSYDVHMSMLLDRLLWWLGGLRVPVVLLSATLSSDKQRRLVDSWQAGALGRDPGPPPAASAFAAYPRVTWADSSGGASVERAVGVSPLNHSRRVELVRVTVSDHVAWALGRAREGQCVAIVHNVVRHAVTAWEGLMQQLASLPEAERPVTILLHGRLTDAERAWAEAAVRRMFGPPTDPGAGERPAQAVVVGTQVLEQSLDLDFDVMVSAMAPVDSLIQRMGRIQRHRRDNRRPPVRMALTGVDHKRGRIAFPPYTTRVYDEAILLRTYAVLRNRAEVICPDEIQGLVDLVYDDVDDRLGCPAGWDEQWAHAHARLRERTAREEFTARTIYLPPVSTAARFHELTSRRASPRRTRRDDPRGGKHAGG